MGFPLISDIVISWILSRPICSEINNAMQEYTSVKYCSSNQHKDLSTARLERDISDTEKIINFLQSKSPFDQSDHTLHSIDTGLVAGDSVNVDNVAEVGDKILAGMLGQNILEYAFKRRDQVVTLATNTAVKTSNKTVLIDPQLLFQRLVTAGSSQDNLNEVFKYELCSYPPSLFLTTDVMLTADKASLANAMWKQLPDSCQGSQVPEDIQQYVLDGGALLHRLRWNIGDTYDDICKKYIKYVTNKYFPVIIVFDGYESGPTTKDATHIKRTNNNTTGLVNFTGDMICTLKKEVFLGNKSNTQRFINLLGKHFQDCGIEVLYAKADADVLIVKTAITSAVSKNTVLVGDDTDLLVLLCSQPPSTACQIYFRPEQKKNSKNPTKCWNIKLVQAVLGRNICDHLLFAHALLGCDTTSRLFGIGKPTALKKLQTSEYFREQASYFLHPDSTRKEIITAGEKALVCLLNGKHDETLDNLRWSRFHQKVASSTISISPCTLPPTSAAAEHHSLRVYLQVQQWKGMNICPEDWGWKMVDGKLLPVQTNRNPAPDYLLDIITCGCKTGCAGNNCSCRKFGLHCSPACMECKGLQCTNVIHIDLDSDTEEL